MFGSTPRPIAKKAMILGIIFVLCFSAVPKPVFAMATIDNAIFWWLQGDSYQLTLSNKIYAALKTAGKIAIRNALKTFLSQIAYQTATMLATAGQSQSPLFDGDAWRDMLENSAASAGADFVQSFASDLLGVDLCNLDPTLKLSLTLGLGRELKPRAPACDWKTMGDQWKKVKDAYSDPKKMAKTMLSFEPTQSDFGIAVSAKQKMIQRQELKAELKKTERWAQEGIKSINDPVAGFVKTPWTVLRGKQESAEENASAGEKILTDDIWADSLSVFTTTLTSKLMKRGINWLGDKWRSWMEDEINIDDLLADAEADVGSLGGKKAAAEHYASLTSVSFNSSNNIDLLTEFESCSSDVKSLNNCTIDSKFGEAIREELTVGEAIEKGLLNAGWPFGFRKVVPGMLAGSEYEPSANEGYAYSSMRKLRLYRVLPLGWEIAAEKIARGLDDGKSYNKIWSLKEIMDAFTIKDSPFYHLVDPNWVFKMSRQECSIMAPSAVLGDVNIRVEGCADVKTCLRENEEDESCSTKYGYCTREQNIWRFDGTECPSYYDSCKSFLRTADKKIFPLLQNSVDFDSCNAGNAGCLWYATQKNPTGEWSRSESPQYRIYLNKYVAACDEKAAGCSEFIRSQREMGTNLLGNGSFEGVFDLQPEDIDDAGNVLENFIGWKDGATLGWATGDTVFGNIALRVAEPVVPDTPVIIEPASSIDTGYPLADRTFTLSFYAKDCKVGSKFLIAGGTEKPFHADNQNDNSWKRYSSTVYFPQGTGQREIMFSLSAVSNSAESLECKIDGIQLEEGSFAGNYAEYGEKNLVYLPKPPAYLNCQGTEADKQECEKYAKVCAEKEVGCNAYTPTSYTGPAINGIVKSVDVCPQECVGYRTYKQSSNYFESEKFPVYFIASSAEVCTADAEGCSEFTNLDELEKTGAERREYYSYLRQCVEPNDPSAPGATYYTWQGSDKTGYYLRNYTLVKISDPALRAHYTALVPPGGDDGSSIEPPVYYIYTGAQDQQDANFNTAQNAKLTELLAECNEVKYNDHSAPADCLAFYDAEGKISYRRLSYTISISDDCQTLRKTKDILSKDECESYLKPDGSHYGWFGNYCDAEETDCKLSGGEWQAAPPAPTACVYHAIPEEGTQCSAEVSSCREYKGNFSYNTREALRQNFEGSPDINGWYGNIALSAESVDAGGHSLKVGDIGLMIPYNTWKHKLWDTIIRPVFALTGIPFLRGGYVAIPVTELLKKEGSEINDVYLLSFTAKGRGNIKIGFWWDDDGVWTGGEQEFPKNRKNFSNGTVNLTTDWKSYNLGPVVLDHDLDDTDDKVVLVFEIDPFTEPYFLDNIVLSETTDIVYLKKYSWKTPAVCDQNNFGVPAPQFHLGCETYTDMNTLTVNAKSFTSLCQDNKAGCEALVNTENSSSPWQETWSALCTLAPANNVCNDASGCDCDEQPVDGKVECRVTAGQKSCRYYRLYDDVPDASIDLSTEVVPKDGISYLVNDPEKQCQSEKKGCMELGQPTLSKAENNANIEATAFTAVYKRNDPDQYGQTLCSAEFATCQEFQNKTSKYYFKDPLDRVCTWKLLEGEETPKWYKKYKTCRGGTGAANGLICYGSKEESECQGTGGDCKDEVCPVPDAIVNPKMRGMSPEIKAAYDLFLVSSGICVKTADNGIVAKACSSNADCLPDGYCYLKWALDCQTQYDQCSAFADNFAENRYFYLDNDEVDKKSCNGLISQKSGCALFENDNIQESAKGPAQKLWSSKATYQESQKRENADVPPIDCSNRENSSICRPTEPYQTGFEPQGSCDCRENTPCMTEGRDEIKCTQNSDCGNGGTCKLEDWGVCLFSQDADKNGIPCPYTNSNNCGSGGLCVFPNDSNDIVKVRRDRVCGEWLDCVSDFKAEDASGRPVQVCSQIERCRTLKEGSTECAEFISDYCTTNSDCYDLYGAESRCDHNFCTKKTLTASAYQKRDVSWAGLEYAGYSLFEKYPIEEYRQGIAGTCSNNAAKTCFSQYDCSGNASCTKASIDDWRLTYFNVSGGNPVSVGIDNRNQTPQDTHKELFPSVVSKSCRAYPEADAPFSASIEASGAFTGINRCDEDPDTNPWGCECTYKKKTAGGIPIYLDTKGSTIDAKTGLCIQADVEEDAGKPCTKDADCGVPDKGATCRMYDKTITLYGWAGYCLEKDFKHNINGLGHRDDFACLTWFPAGIVRGEVDTFNYSITAGYTLAENRDAFCAGYVAGNVNDDFIINDKAQGNINFGERDKTHTMHTDPDGNYYSNTDDTPSLIEIDNCEQQGDGLVDGCFTWCYAPQKSMIGCYAISDNNSAIGGCEASDQDSVYVDGRQSGRLTYEWAGPKIYRQATKAIRFVAAVSPKHIRNFVSRPTDFACRITDTEPADHPADSHTWTSDYNEKTVFTKMFPSSFISEGAGSSGHCDDGVNDSLFDDDDGDGVDEDTDSDEWACIDLGEQNEWDSDPGKVAGDQSNNCNEEWTGLGSENKGCLRFKVNWKEEEESGFDVLDSMEVWATDWNGEGVFGVRRIMFFYSQHCALIVSAVDDNLSGPNVVADTEKLYRNFGGNINGVQYTTQCEPFGAIALGGEYDDGTHRVLAVNPETSCKLDLYKKELGNQNYFLESLTTIAEALDPPDPIFKIFPKVFSPRSVNENETNAAKDLIYYNAKNLVVKDNTYSIGEAYDGAGVHIWSVTADNSIPPRLVEFHNKKISALGGELTAKKNIAIAGQEKIDLVFFAYDSGGTSMSHMPLRRVKIDWDVPDMSSPDGRLVQVFEGSYKNHKAICDAGSGLFKWSSDACVDKPFSFSYVYTCPGPGAPGWEAHDGDDNDGTNRLLFGEDISGKCVFRPRVQVTNNWGWCNLGGPDANSDCLNDEDTPGEMFFCYGGSQPGATIPRECDNDSQNSPSWAYLGESSRQYIIVTPAP